MTPPPDVFAAAASLREQVHSATVEAVDALAARQFDRVRERHAAALALAVPAAQMSARAARDATARLSPDEPHRAQAAAGAVIMAETANSLADGAEEHGLAPADAIDAAREAARDAAAAGAAANEPAAVMTRAACDAIGRTVAADPERVIADRARVGRPNGPSTYDPKGAVN